MKPVAHADEGDALRSVAQARPAGLVHGRIEHRVGDRLGERCGQQPAAVAQPRLHDDRLVVELLSLLSVPRALHHRRHGQGGAEAVAELAIALGRAHGIGELGELAAQGCDLIELGGRDVHGRRGGGSRPSVGNASLVARHAHDLADGGDVARTFDLFGGRAVAAGL